MGCELLKLKRDKALALPAKLGKALALTGLAMTGEVAERWARLSFEQRVWVRVRMWRKEGKRRNSLRRARESAVRAVGAPRRAAGVPRLAVAAVGRRKCVRRRGCGWRGEGAMETIGGQQERLRSLRLSIYKSLTDISRVPGSLTLRPLGEILEYD